MHFTLAGVDKVNKQADAELCYCRGSMPTDLLCLSVQERGRYPHPFLYSQQYLRLFCERPLYLMCFFILSDGIFTLSLCFIIDYKVGSTKKNVCMLMCTRSMMTKYCRYILTLSKNMWVKPISYFKVQIACSEIVDKVNLVILFTILILIVWTVSNVYDLKLVAINLVLRFFLILRLQHFMSRNTFK